MMWRKRNGIFERNIDASAMNDRSWSSYIFYTIASVKEYNEKFIECSVVVWASGSEELNQNRSTLRKANFHFYYYRAVTVARRGPSTFAVASGSKRKSNVIDQRTITPKTPSATVKSAAIATVARNCKISCAKRLVRTMRIIATSVYGSQRVCAFEFPSTRCPLCCAYCVRVLYIHFISFQVNKRARERIFSAEEGEMPAERTDIYIYLNKCKHDIKKLFTTLEHKRALGGRSEDDDEEFWYFHIFVDFFFLIFLFTYMVLNKLSGCYKCVIVVLCMSACVYTIFPIVRRAEQTNKYFAGNCVRNGGFSGPEHR